MSYSTKSKTLSLLFNVILGAFGLWLIFNPSFGVQMFQLCVGIALLIAAAGLGYTYVDNGKTQNMTLIQAIVCALLGVIFLVSTGVASTFLGIALMIGMLFDGVINLRLSTVYKKLKIERWWILALYGIGAIVLGIYLLFNLSSSAKMLIILTGFFVFSRSVFMIFDTILCKEEYYHIEFKDK